MAKPSKDVLKGALAAARDERQRVADDRAEALARKMQAERDLTALGPEVEAADSGVKALRWALRLLYGEDEPE
jgi:hypothetical protein